MADTSIQPKEWAFNLALVGYRHGIQDRVRSQVLGVRKITNKLTSSATGCSLSPSDAELNLRTPGATAVIWIGMRPGSAPKYNQKAQISNRQMAKADGERASVLKGDTVNKLSTDTVIEVPYDPSALRVVCKVDAKNAQYYALADRDQAGLCIAYQIGYDEVFFFDEFRNGDISAYNDRKLAWPKLVRDACAIHSGKAPELPRSRHMDDTPTFRQPAFKQSVAAGVVSEMATYAVEPSSAPLRNALALLDIMDKDEGSEGLQQSSNLWILANGPEVLSVAQSEKALDELTKLHPDLVVDPPDGQLIDAPGLLMASKALRSSDQVLEYRMIRPFVVQFIDAYNGPYETDEEVVLCNRILHQCYRQWGHAPTRPAQRHSPSHNSHSSLCETQARWLAALADFTGEFLEGMRDSQGDFATTHSTTYAVEMLSKSADVDAAKLAATAIHRRNVADISTHVQEVVSLIRDRVEKLQQTAADLRAAEDAETAEE